jgi:hypothetical protein
MNHAGFMISPELNVVQDKVQGYLHPMWCRGGEFFLLAIFF